MFPVGHMRLGSLNTRLHLKHGQWSPQAHGNHTFGASCLNTMFTCGEIQWLSLEVHGVNPFTMLQVSHVHRLHSSVEDIEVCLAHATHTHTTYEACMSYLSYVD